MESRRSRKQREVVYQNGIQSNVLKEISTPLPDGSIPLISFLENVNYSIMELYDFNSRISALEGGEKKEEDLVNKMARKEDVEEMSKNNDLWKKDVSESIDSIETKIKQLESTDKFVEILKMENDISNQYFIIQTKLDNYVNEQYNAVLSFKNPAVRLFSDNLKKLIETKIISFDNLLEQVRIELKNKVKEVSIKIKTEYIDLITRLTQLSNTMNKDIIDQKGDENMSIEIRLKKESCFNNIYIDIKNKYRITQLSIQTLYINILSEISNMCSFLFGKIEALLQNGSMSDVQLVLRLDDFTEELINTTEEDIGFDLDIKMNHANREEYEFDLFKQTKKQEKVLMNKTL
jgi:hypothetical protein